MSDPRDDDEMEVVYVGFGNEQPDWEALEAEAEAEWDEEDEGDSKSARKRQMHALQAMGLRLSKVSPAIRKALDIPEELEQAIREYQSIKSRPALKRQAQFIGRLMRDFDLEEMEQRLLEMEMEQKQAQRTGQSAKLSPVDLWTAYVLETGDEAINELLAIDPEGDRQQLRQWLRNAAKEQKTAKPGKATKRLRQYLSELDLPALD